MSSHAPILIYLLIIDSDIYTRYGTIQRYYGPYITHSHIPEENQRQKYMTTKSVLGIIVNTVKFLRGVDLNYQQFQRLLV